MRTSTVLALVLACFVAKATCTESYKDTDWMCMLSKERRVGAVHIWWGFKAGDAAWACNNWNGHCRNEGGCTAVRFPKYACLKDGAVVDTVSIWWGYADGDAAWACNQWSSRCSRACTATRDLKYVCLRGGAVVDSVSIWWGYADGDAAWACNKWSSRCSNVCTAKVAVTPQVPSRPPPASPRQARSPPPATAYTYTQG
jgi:hypothetical protein